MFKKSADVVAELQKLLPLMRDRMKTSKSSCFQLSALINSTTQSKVHYNDSALHFPSCDVAQGLTGWTLVSSDLNFNARPCEVCLNFRVHSLACQAFSMEFDTYCFSAGECFPSNELEQQLVEDFGSFDGFKSQIIVFCSSSLYPGRTWVVFDPKVNKIHLLNLSGAAVPITMGLWPLGVINMTEKKLCDSVMYSSRTEAKQGAPWKRETRCGIQAGSSSEFPTEIHGSLSQVKRMIAANALKKFNWRFMSEQLLKAKKYFASDSRETTRSSWRKKQEKIVTEEALRPYNRHLSNRNRSHDAIYSPVNSDQIKIVNSTNLASSSSSSKEVVDSPQRIHHSDTKVWEYIYTDGRRTLLHPDGTQVFITRNEKTTVLPDNTKIYERENVTITVRTDGSSLFEYPDRTSILKQSNGWEITTFPNGTTTKKKIGS